MKASVVLSLGLASTALGSVMKRDDVKVLCGQPPDHSDLTLLASLYSYPVGQLLGAAGGDAVYFEPGPANCKNVACNPSDDGPNVGTTAGVTVCSDDSNEIPIGKQDMGWFAQRIYEQCKVRIDNVDYLQKGQVFVPGAKWNVILSDLGPDAQCL
ncbi:hypothetical protein F4821DRAFT_278291 [Hypoxylon rubiginosum]|uniref:Uncharacterized protein n=1 Tax=Hypoxylon rubiginosum TaxID=110542 RepID=A0ACC0D2S8_9PEZI|nr:hypothetical protein F4821DRAFT_278291 [Hypoxylon rubiginosum]